MARKMYFQVIRRVDIEETITLDNTAVSIPCSTRQMRDALTSAACKIYGREDRDWLLVQDNTVIGFHVRALGAFDGETLELHI